MKRILSQPADKIPSMEPIVIFSWLNESKILVFFIFCNRLENRQQTLKELKEVMLCVEINQREFVETIYVC